MIEYEWIWTNQWQSHSLRRVVVIRHMYYTWDLVKWLCVFKVTTVLQKSYRNKGGSVEETLTKIQQNLNFLTLNWESGFVLVFVRKKHFKIWHRRAFCQFLFRWIYYYGSNKFTGKETGKTHLFVVIWHIFWRTEKRSEIKLPLLLSKNYHYSRKMIKNCIYLMNHQWR